MRAAATITLLIVLSLAISVSSVLVPFTSCAKQGAHISVSNITANYWPPVKGDALSISINGYSDENITAGTFEIDVLYEGVKIDEIDGSVCTLDACPISVGAAAVVYNVTIPSIALPGSYEIDISAVDQSKQQLLCVKINFKLSSPLESLRSRIHTPRLPRWARHQDTK